MSGPTPYNVLKKKMCDSDENCIWPSKKNDENDGSDEVCQCVYIPKDENYENDDNDENDNNLMKTMEK